MMVVLHIKNDRLKHSSVRHIDFALNKLFFLHKSLDVVCIFEIYLSETHNRKGSMSPKKTENEVQCSQKDHSHEDKVGIYIWVTLFTCFYRKQMTMFIFEVTQLQTSFK
jgi:hypothetical protein